MGQTHITEFGTNHSKGTAIHFNKNFNILNSHLSEDSRIILASIKIEDEIFTLLNIYAPNNMNERKCFFP